MGGDACPLFIARGVARVAQDPGQKLPVTPHPPMVAAGGHLVVGGKFLKEIHIGRQPGARERTLEEIVAEESVLRNLPLEGRLEGIEVVDPLSRVRPLPEEILIHIGDRGRVGIHTSGARDDPLVRRASRACRQGRREAGLQDREPLDDTFLAGIETRPIQRVRHRPDQAAGGSPGQPGVGIQCDDVAYALRDRGLPTVDWNERGVPGAAKKPVQLMELPAFSLPPDPLALLLVPETPTMQQKESLPAAGRTPVPRVEARDAVGQRGQEILVTGHPLIGRVRPIRKEAKVEMASGIREIVDLEPLERPLDVGLTREQRGHDDQGPKLRGHALGQLELGEQPGWNEKRNQPVDECHRDIRGGHQTEDPQQDEDPGGCPRGPGQEQKAGKQQCGEGRDRSQVTRDRVGAIGAAEPDS